MKRRRKLRDIAAVFDRAFEILGTPDLASLLNRVMTMAVKFCHGHHGGLFLLCDETTLELREGYGLGEIDKGMHIAIGSGITGWVAKHKKTCIVDDVSADDRFVRAFRDVESEIAVPIFDLSAELIGVLNVESSRLKAFGDFDRLFLEQLCAYAGFAIPSHIQKATRDRERLKLEQLREIDLNLLQASTNQETLLEIGLQACVKLTNARSGLVLLGEGNSLVIAASVAGVNGQILDVQRLEWESLTGENGRQVDPVEIPDPIWLSLPGAQLRMRSELAVPIRDVESIIGVLNVEAVEPNVFSRSVARVLEELTAKAAHRSRTKIRDRRYSALEPMLSKAIRISGADSGQLVFPNPFGGPEDDLIVTNTTGPEGVGTRIPSESSVVSQVFSENKSLVVDDVVERSDYRAYLGDCPKAILAVPLLIEDHKIGLILVESEDPHALDRDCLETLREMMLPVSVGVRVARLVRAAREGHAKRANAIITEQSVDLVHRIKSPAIGISHSVNYVRDHYGHLFATDEDLRERFEVIQAGAAEIVTLSKQLRAERDMLSLEEISVNALILGAMGSLILPSMSVSVQLSLTNDNPQIRANERFESVMLDLIVNAADSMLPGGGVVDVSSKLRKGTVIVEVADAGCGIPEHYKPQIWDSGFTTKRDGTGDGLFLCRSYIVGVCGGSIGFRDRSPAGTVFSIELPVL